MKHPLLLFAAPAAMLCLVGPGFAGFAQDGAGQGAGRSIAPGVAGASPAALGPHAEPLTLLDRARWPQSQFQVRIERRVVIRVAPSAAPALPLALAAARTQAPRQPSAPARYEEVEHGDCVDVDQVGGVRPISGNRLLFVMRDKRLLAVSLGRECSARAFYSGFYVEKRDDGQLCAARDRLQSRAGASCEVAGFSRLLAVSP